MKFLIRDRDPSICAGISKVGVVQNGTIMAIFYVKKAASKAVDAVCDYGGVDEKTKRETLESIYSSALPDDTQSVVPSSGNDLDDLIAVGPTDIM